MDDGTNTVNIDESKADEDKGQQLRDENGQEIEMSKYSLFTYLLSGK
jgi:hypothetical protein